MFITMIEKKIFTSCNSYLDVRGFGLVQFSVHAVFIVGAKDDRYVCG